jgi:ubiquinone/menaquinone biosynthesis C-methylase UbiE
MTSKDYFDQVAGQWDALRASFYPDSVRDLALAAADVQAGQLGADIGAGTGFITAGLIGSGLRVIAVDQSEAMLAQMRGNFPDVDAIDYRAGESESLPIHDAIIDCVFANMYLHHVESPLAAINEMARILKPGGKLVITDLDEHRFEFLRAEHHDRWMGFKRQDVVAWFAEVGLKSITVEGVGSDCCADSDCGTEQASVSIFIAYGEK